VGGHVLVDHVEGHQGDRRGGVARRERRLQRLGGADHSRSRLLLVVKKSLSASQLGQMPPELASMQ
jgi:hypothetical protein